MRSIALNGALLASLFCCSVLAAEQARVDHEPVFGVVVDWKRLEPLPGKLYGEAPTLERRILARVPAGPNELVFALSLLPITGDTDEFSPLLGYETDAGVLIKRLGALNIPLGASSGRLAQDYPEIDPQVIRLLLRTYVANLVTHFGSPAALRQALLENGFCAQADPMALLELERIGVGDACMAGTKPPYQFWQKTENAPCHHSVEPAASWHWSCVAPLPGARQMSITATRYSA